MRFAALAFAALLPLAACAGGQITPTGQAAITAGVTLAQAAAAENKTVAQVVVAGQVFCAVGPAIYAVLAAGGKPSTVINQTAGTVAQACQAINPVAVPVPAPANPGSVPTLAPAAPVLPPQPAKVTA